MNPSKKKQKVNPLFAVTTLLGNARSRSEVNHIIALYIDALTKEKITCTNGIFPDFFRYGFDSKEEYDNYLNTMIMDKYPGNKKYFVRFKNEKDEKENSL